MAIDTDYSFLNLPEAGSKAQGPIARPSFDPVDFSFNLDRYAPQNLPDVEMVAPSLPSFSADRNEAVLNSVRPFEDIRTLGATFGQKLAETEKFFGDQVNKLQGNIDDLINTKSDLTKQLEAAFLQQDEMSQQAIEEQIAALDKQRAELTSLLEQKVAEAEAEGVDAVAAAEKVASDQRQQFEGQISSLDQQLQDLEVSKQEAIAAGDQQRVAELEAQQQELTAQREQIVAQMEQEFGGERSEFEGQISSLEDQLSQLEIDKELAIQAGDEQRVAELEAQEQQLIQQRDELVAQMEQQFGGEKGELEARIAEIESAQQAAIAERDQAIAEQDTIRAQAAEQQAAALENLKQELLTERAGIVGGLEGTIGDLQGEIDGLTGARDVAISERDQAIAQQDTIRAEAADAQAQALDAQANDYQAQLDELTGQSSQYQTQLGERDQTIADLQAQLAALQGSGQPPADTPPPPPPPPPFKEPPPKDPITRPPMCFVAGTKVDMADGTKKVIENIAVGDKVLALDNETDVVSYVHDIPEAERNLWTINDKITATDAHAFLTEDGWKSNNARLSNAVYNDYGIDVKTLKVGDKLITKDGLEKVTKLESEKDFVKVYNFTTSNTHTYLVDGVVSHNKMARPPIDRPPVDGPPREGPPMYVPGGTPGFYDRPPFKKPPIGKFPGLPDPRDDYISYEREPIVPNIKPSPKLPSPRIGGGIGGFPGKTTGRMMRR